MTATSLVREIRVRYNTPGHPTEFTIHLDGYDHDCYIPNRLADRVQHHVPERWLVSNRGNRLEINSMTFTGAGDEHAPTVQEALTHAVREVLGEEANIDTELFAYTPPPPPPLRECRCGCGQSLPMREVLAHMREAGMLTSR